MTLQEIEAIERRDADGLLWAHGISGSVVLSRDELSDLCALAKRATWQPIATAPTDREVFFWVRPKTADEAFVDTNGRPIVSRHAPRLHRGRVKSWSAMETATRWMELPDPPIGERE